MNCTCWYATPTQVKPHKNKGDGHFLKYYNLKQWYWNCHFEKIRLLCWQTASTCYIRQLFTKAETSRSKATSRCVDLSFFSNHENHRRTRRGSGETAAPLAWKISGETLFSGQAQFAQKFRMTKDISIQWKIPGQLRFQGKRKLLKNPECKKYIQYSEIFQGTLCFSGQAQVAQKSWM